MNLKKLNQKRDYTRSLDNIDCIVLHQTAYNFRPNEKEWSGVNCHYGVNSNGLIFELYDPKYLCFHANSFNKRSIGIEINGNFEGIKGDTRTLWKPRITSWRHEKASLTSQQIESTIELIVHLLEHYPTIKYLFAHRQSSFDRIADCGQEIWQEIALTVFDRYPQTVSDGYEDGYLCEDSGYPLPDIWTKQNRGFGYYERKGR